MLKLNKYKLYSFNCIQNVGIKLGTFYLKQEIDDL